MFMQIEITLKNYRCFPDSKPATFSLQKGFTSFVGVNNSGKSSLLKFFYEFRPLFNKILNPNQLITAMRGNAQNFTAAPSILDNEEVF
ncbi:MAG: AAA family ATPase, partial [Desulfosporosinus sp.]|nr:AAA family ATPase [Desulfosporosinus sp.]